MRICSKSLLFLGLALAVPGWSQILSFGVKGGVPITDGFPSSSAAYERRYTVGPTVEVHLPLHLSFEVDALYRREGEGGSYTRYFDQPSPVLIVERARVNDWQVPFLLKWQVGSRSIRPFIDGGATYRHVSGQTATQLYESYPSFAVVSTTAPGVVLNGSSAGVTFGAGVSAKLLLLRISPELRYTHWSSTPWIGNSLEAHATANQFDFLVGFTF